MKEARKLATGASDFSHGAWGMGHGGWGMGHFTLRAKPKGGHGPNGALGISAVDSDRTAVISDYKKAKPQSARPFPNLKSKI
ncbi:hypothetical protein [Microcoleus sp. bin38.metabat.b11b12b14.051]|uniref:hypothetical protein n=1 Tax=Microcoleus sp. bin38.metabat.b11b12b14.051 TaxID=2742709 RepID=UPI0025CC6078|nr:hypothetical protein [Microcoleus sp. bin38.metabat.b11b12b14.051]